MNEPRSPERKGFLAYFDWLVPVIQGFETLKWMIGFTLVIMLLPLWSLRSPTVATAFWDQRWLAVGVSALALQFAAWGLMLCSSLRITGEQIRATPHAPVRKDLEVLASRFRLPLTAFQCVLLHLVAMPGTVILVGYSTEPKRALVSAIVAILVANFLAAFLEASLLPQYRNDSGQATQGRSPTARIGRWGITHWFRCRFDWLREQASRVIAVIGIDDILDDASPRQVQPEHFLVMCNAGLTLGVLLLIAFLRTPPFDPDWLLATPFLIFTVLAMAIWLIGALEFHLPRFRITPLAAIAIGMFILAVRGSFDDHEVEGVVREKAVAQWPTPIDVVAVPNESPNLVVVCATGGGILAAGWTSYVLERLIGNGDVERQEIRLLSTVSGGSVGALYSLLAWNDPSPGALDAAVRGATDSSLPAVLYGMVFTDPLSTITAGGSRYVYPETRGTFLDQQWDRNAEAAGLKVRPEYLGGFVEQIRAGKLPLMIFNTTAMETGRRVMITPANFNTSNSTALARAQTLTEYLLGFDTTVDPNVSTVPADTVPSAPGTVAAPPQDAGPPPNPLLKRREGEWVANAKESPEKIEPPPEVKAFVVDVPTWSAARLSATFPYLTPASRIRMTGPVPEIAASRDGAKHHFIDGGYYDNYGVASALDFLEPVLEHRLGEKSRLHFRRVAIVEIRAFPTPDPKDVEPSSSFTAEVIGPVRGVTNIRDGAAASRNAIELSRFIDRYRTKKQDGEPRTENDLDIQSFVFELTSDAGNGPLSWTMTTQQIADMRDNWSATDKQTGERALELRRFLGR